MDTSVNEDVLPVLDVERTIFASVRNGAFDPKPSSESNGAVAKSCPSDHAANVMDKGALTFREVDKSNFADFVHLFESRGGPKSCWCMVWRATSIEAKHTDGKSRRAALCSRVAAGVPIGILAYRDDGPLAWCSIAPRPTYRRLGGPDDYTDNPEAVWSLACFFIKRAHRAQGICDQLLQEAIALARRRGARIVEAYPVAPDSPSYRFMGFVNLFERFGFEEIGTAGTRRHVMRLKL